jgi:hypothetical protein
MIVIKQITFFVEQKGGQTHQNKEALSANILGIDPQLMNLFDFPARELLNQV